MVEVNFFISNRYKNRIIFLIGSVLFQKTTIKRKCPINFIEIMLSPGLHLQIL